MHASSSLGSMSFVHASTLYVTVFEKTDQLREKQDSFVTFYVEFLRLGV